MIGGVIAALAEPGVRLLQGRLNWRRLPASGLCVSLTLLLLAGLVSLLVAAAVRELGAAAKLVRPGGRFYMVHRPFRLAEIIRTLSAYKLEPKRMRLVYPYVDREPNMVLLEAVRGGKPRMTVEKPLVVYEKPGVYMPEILDLYGY